MSTLHVLLLFVGGPLLIIAVITLLVMAPSLAKGPRYRPSQQWDADAEWFGAPGKVGNGSDQRLLESSSTAQRGDDHDETGGASASW
jgi:hypothetical protein